MSSVFHVGTLFVQGGFWGLLKEAILMILTVCIRVLTQRPSGALLDAMLLLATHLNLDPAIEAIGIKIVLDMMSWLTLVEL